MSTDGARRGLQTVRTTARNFWRLNRDYAARTWALRSMPEGFGHDLAARVGAEARCILFLSTGRCGTEYASSLLEPQAGLSVHHRPVPELAHVARISFAGGPEAELALAVWFARYEGVRDSFLRGQTYVETAHHLTFSAAGFRSTFPGTRFVHLVRDPLAFVESALRSGFYDGGRYDEGRIEPSTTDPVAADWPGLSRAEKCAWLWNATNGFIEDLKAEGSTETLTVRSDDLFQSSEARATLASFIPCGRLIDRGPRNTSGRPTGPATPAVEVLLAVERFASLRTMYEF